MMRPRVFWPLLLLGEAAALLLAPQVLAASATVPFLLERGFTLYHDLILQYPPLYFWGQALLQPAVPDPLTRLLAQSVLLAWALTALVGGLARRSGGDARRAAVLTAVWLAALGGTLYSMNGWVALLGLLALALAPRAGLLAGVVVGMALATKQQAVFLLPLPLVVPGVRPARFLAGVGLVGGLVLLVLWRTGALADALYWSVTYNLTAYADSRPGLAPLALALYLVLALPLVLCGVRRGAALWLGLGALVVSAPDFSTGHVVMSAPFFALALRPPRPVPRRLLWGWAAAALVVAALYSVGQGMTGQPGQVRDAAVWLRARGATTTALLIVPGDDWHDPLYAAAGVTPPPYWMPTYGWFWRLDAPRRAYLAALAAQPPPYALRVASRYAPVPPELDRWLAIHCTPLDRAVFGRETYTLLRCA